MSEDEALQQRRTYYDHEPVWRRIADEGGRGWDHTTPTRDPGSYTALDAFLASDLAPPASPTCCAVDLGCGAGQAAMRLARAGYRVTGVDYAATALELARRNAEDAQLFIRFLVDDCTRLERVPTGSAHVAVDNHLLHCLVERDDRDAFFAALRDMLTPDGVWFSETMCCEMDFDPAAVGADPDTRVSYSGTRIWVSEAELDAELSAAGLEVLLRQRRPPSAGEPGVGGTLVTVARQKVVS
jgi:SAM-dependent methyltransferase